jgi:hypothetical protein
MANPLINAGIHFGKIVRLYPKTGTGFIEDVDEKWYFFMSGSIPLCTSEGLLNLYRTLRLGDKVWFYIQTNPITDEKYPGQTKAICVIPVPRSPSSFSTDMLIQITRTHVENYNARFSIQTVHTAYPQQVSPQAVQPVVIRQPQPVPQQVVYLAQQQPLVQQQVVYLAPQQSVVYVAPQQPIQFVESIIPQTEEVCKPIAYHLQEKSLLPSWLLGIIDGNDISG